MSGGSTTVSLRGVGPYWLSAFLDFAPDEYDAGVAHWQRLTDRRLSRPRGRHGEFATLLSPDGDDYLKVQRLAEGPSRVHLDLHVIDIDPVASDAERHGATRLADHSDFVVLRSPGGFPFCLVDHEASVRPLPTRWSAGHRSLLDQICLDIPRRHWETEPAFWEAITGWESTAAYRDEYRALRRPDDVPLRILLQRLDEPDGDVRAHLDWSTTDRDAEVARHLLAGSKEGTRAEVWTVLTGPGGTYCVTDRHPDTGLLPGARVGP